MNMQSVKGHSGTYLHAQCEYVYYWSNKHSMMRHGLLCEFSGLYMWPLKTLVLLSTNLSPSLTDTLSFGCSTFCLSSPISPLSIPLSVGGMSWPSVVQRRLERDWEDERKSDRVGESEECCDIVNAVNVELNRGKAEWDMCEDSVTAVEGREGLTGTEISIEKEKQGEERAAWYCHCGKTGSEGPLSLIYLSPW